MTEYFECINNNIFDVDNKDNINYNNSTYSNGFSRNQSDKNCYIKKKVKNHSIRNRNNLSNIELPETITSEKYYRPSETTHDTFGIETIPIYNLKLSQTKDENGQIYNKQKIYIIKKNVKNLLNNIKNKKNSNSSINEINISLKKLKIRNKIKNNSYKNIKKISRNTNTQIINNIMKNHNTISSKSYTNFSLLNPKEKIKKIKINRNVKINNKFNVQIENRFSFINNENNNNIIFLKKIIYKQNNNIKELREQNKKLIDKIKNMNEENKAILEVINSLKNEINNKNMNHENYINSKSYIKDKYYTESNENNNLIKIKENILKSKNTLYCLYDNNNILSYDFLNNKFKLNQIVNEDFNGNFNKEINKLYLYNKINNEIYIIAGINNDLFFIYDINKNKMNLYSKLKNNHMFGSLLLLSQNNNKKEKLICLSGKYNKKVEIYNEENDTWDDKIIEEMPEERCNACYLLLNHNYIYGFYGYNFILNKYLNDIIYYDYNNNKWNKILENSLNNNINGIQNHFCYKNDKNNLIHILGGDSNYNKIIIDLDKNEIIKIEENKENKENKDKEEKYLFNNNCMININNDFITLFDNNYNVHLINIVSNEKEIIQYHKDNK